MNFNKNRISLWCVRKIIVNSRTSVRFYLLYYPLRNRQYFALFRVFCLTLGSTTEKLWINFMKVLGSSPLWQEKIFEIFWIIWVWIMIQEFFFLLPAAAPRFIDNFARWRPPVLRGGLNYLSVVFIRLVVNEMCQSDWLLGEYIGLLLADTVVL